MALFLQRCHTSAVLRSLFLLAMVAGSRTLAFSVQIHELEPPRPRLTTHVPALSAIDPATVQVALEHLLLHAQIVFSGQVLPSGNPASPLPDSTAVRILVDHGLRGVQDGDIFLYRYWQSTGRMVLPPGERVLLFLHQPNAAGLTSASIAEFSPLVITGEDQVDIRQLVLLERQLTVYPWGGREPPSSASAPTGCLRLLTAHEGLAMAAVPREDQTYCQRGPLPGPPEAAASMPATQLLALVRRMLKAAPQHPDDAFHAP